MSSTKLPLLYFIPLMGGIRHRKRPLQIVLESILLFYNLMQNHVISHVLDGRKFSVDFYQERERELKNNLQ
jgi:hypothetical protein